MNNSNVVEDALRRNGAESKMFEANQAERRKLRDHECTTAMAMVACPGGRCANKNIGIVPGTVEVWRIPGSDVDIDDPKFRASFFDGWLAHERGRGKKDAIVMVSFHFAPSDPQLGCGAMRCDSLAAQRTAEAKAEELARIERYYRPEASAGFTFHAVVCGFNTDAQALVFTKRGSDEAFDLSTLAPGTQRDQVKARLRGFFADVLPSAVIDDLSTLAWHNLKRVELVRLQEQPPARHEESIIAVGRGMEDWLGKEAFVWSPFGLREAREQTAALFVRLLLKNFQEGVIQKNRGVGLITGFPYRDFHGREAAAAKARNTGLFMLQAFKAYAPELLPHLYAVAGIVNPENRRFRRTETLWEPTQHVVLRNLTPAGGTLLPSRAES